MPDAELVPCPHCGTLMDKGECFCPDCIGALALGINDPNFGKCRFCKGSGMVSKELAEEMRTSMTPAISVACGCRGSSVCLDYAPARTAV